MPKWQGVIRWENPPPAPTGREELPAVRAWAIVAAELRSHPGKWGLIDEVGTPSIAPRIARGVSWWAPKGAFESTTRTINGVVHTWARYIGEGGDSA